MANKKKEYYKPGPMTEGKRNIIQGLLQEYDIQSAADIQEALNRRQGTVLCLLPLTLPQRSVRGPQHTFRPRCRGCRG